MAIASIFFETDFCGDIDDVGGLAIILARVHAKKCKLIGVNANSSNHYSASAIATMVGHCGVGSIPVGAYQGDDTPTGSAYTFSVTSRFGKPGDNRTKYPNGVANLRRVLNAQPEASVTLLSTGTLINLQGLMRSVGDEKCSLSGMQLITSKISSFVVMGGCYPSGQEWNFSNDPLSASYVIKNWPLSVPIWGVDFVLGASIVWTLPKGDVKANPFAYAYELFGGATRPAWDPLAALYAVGDYAHLFNVQGSNGTNMIDPTTGFNTWTSAARNYSYLGVATVPSAIATALNQLIAQTS